MKMPTEGYSVILSESRCTGFSIAPLVTTIHRHSRYGGCVIKIDSGMVGKECVLYCILNNAIHLSLKN